jgi:Ca-activated chloride channel homolog
MADSFIIQDPGALRFLLLIPVIVLLYMVRSRYRRHRISSIMLWRSVRRDMEARQRLRLPPLSLLMFLQILVIAVAAIALTRPALPATDRAHLVVLVDLSASMLSTDVEPSRFDVARHWAREAIRRTQPGDQVSLIGVGPSPWLLASATDASEALAALGRMRPGAASVDVNTALALAESLVRNTGGQGEILFLSDGVFGSRFLPPPLSVPVDFRSIGISGNNQGITALEARPDLDGSGRWTAFARVSNYAQQAVEISATATADDLLLETRQLQLPPRSSSELAFALPAQARSFALELDSKDILSADNRAEIQVRAWEPRSVLLVSRDPGPIERLLETFPAVEVTTVDPRGYQGARGSHLVILDGFLPASLPNADLLVMNPPDEAPGFVIEPGSGESPVLRSRQGSPLLQSVDLQSLRLGQVVRLEAPDWAHAVAEGPAGPLILEGTLEGRRIIILNFDWMLFDLPRMQAFPLLLSNAMAELNPLALPSSVPMGQSVLLRPLAGASETTVRMPDGSQREFSLKQGAVSFAETQQVGRYEVRWKGEDWGEASASFNVNVSSHAQSDVMPGVHSFGQGQTTRGLLSGPVPGLQLWPFLVMLMLSLLAVEWVYFSRRS